MNLNRGSSITILLAMLVALSSVARADGPFAQDIPDDSSIRAAILNSWLLAMPSEVLSKRSELRDVPGGGRLEIRAERGNGEFMIVLARERNSAFSAWAPGSWVAYRTYSEGKVTRIRMFPTNDSHVYLQFRPQSADRSYLDLIAYGGYLARSIVIPQSMDRLLVLSVAQAISSAGPEFPLHYLKVHPDNYANIRFLSSAIRSRLGELTYADDGAYDAAGKGVFIENLAPQSGAVGVNCSGFAKWIVDGILRPITGRRLDISSLKVRTIEGESSLTEKYEQKLDPYFGLDWTRNLASAASRVLLYERDPDPDDYEVRRSPISALRVPGGDGSAARSCPDYREGAGFQIESLKPMLYALAINEPGSFYLASISSDRRWLPRIRRHFHVAVLLPQFDESGVFSVVLFESAAETDFDSFVERYPDCMVNLVRVPVERRFDP